MEAPLVSVIVLCYNSERSIERTIRSVLAQECQFPYEIVVGDDDSSDRSRQLVLDLAAAHPGVIRLMPEAPNRGLVDNYFYCLSECRGKYVTDCAADDYWTLPTRLQRQVAMLERDPRCVAVCTDWTTVDSGSGDRTVNYSPVQPSVADVLSEKGVTLCLSTFLYRADVVRAAIERNRDMVANSEFGCEDLPVMCALAAAGRIERIPHSTLDYVSAKGSVSHGASLEREFIFQKRTITCIMELGRFYDVDSRRYASRLRRKLSHLASIAFRSGNAGMRETCRSLYKSAGLMPGLKPLLLLMVMGSDALWTRVRLLLEKIKPL